MSKKSAQIQLIKKVNLLEQVTFTRHLATMLKAGIPIDEALESIAKQTPNPYFKEILNQAISDLGNGQLLSSTLSKNTKAFSPFYISLIKVSEESGTLVENLTFLAEQLNKTYVLKKKIQSALIYPGLIVSASVILGGFVSLFVLPQLVGFFDSFNVELPLATKILLGVAHFMEDYGLFFFGGLLLLGVSLRLMLLLEKVRKVFDHLVLKLPLLGRILQLNNLAKFSRNLGILLKSGIPISKALVVAEATISNRKFKQTVKLLGAGVNKGQPIVEILDSPDFWEIPPTTVTMLGVGEKSGSLEDSLLYLGDFYEEELDTFSNNMSTILEPFLLLVIGLLVGFIALAIISPIYELTGSVRG